MAARFETRKKSGVLGTALFHCHSKTNPPACLSPGIAFFPHKMGSWQCYLRIPTLRFVCQIGETHSFAFLNIVAEFLPGCQDGFAVLSVRPFLRYRYTWSYQKPSGVSAVAIRS